MQLSLTSDYAIRALLCLASHPQGTMLRIAEVATAAEIPDNYFRKILAALTRAGFVRSARGVKGGIQLAVLAKDVTLLDVFEAVEGKLFLNSCLISPGMCHRSTWCAVHTTWAEVQQKMKEMLSDKTLADLAQANAFNLAQILKDSAN